MVVVCAPDYLPGQEFMALVRRADTLVLGDTFQYSRQSFQNRARVRSPQGWHWLTIPLLGKQHGRPIRNTRIDRRTDWAAAHRRSVQYNYKTAPFYDYYIDALMALWAAAGDTLGPLTCASVEWLAQWLASHAVVWRASRLEGAPSDIGAICEVLGRGDVLLPPSRIRHDAHLVADPHVATIHMPAYPQNFEGFEPGLSALDLLFTQGPEAGRLLDAAIVGVERVQIGRSTRR
jgi:hypothetical protein